MNRMQFSLTAFAGAALLATTSIARAQPAPPAQRPAAPVLRPAAPKLRPAAPANRPLPPDRNDRHRRGDHWRDHHEAGAYQTPQDKAKRDAWRQADEKRRDEMRKSRDSRRKARREQLRKKWGDKTLQAPQAHSEMQTHSWRQARLQRLRTLAQEQNRQDLVTRIDKLEKEEQTRHDNAMNRYKGGQK